MRAEIRAQNINKPQDYQEYIDQRIERQLKHFHHRLSSITVWLEDVNGPKGCIDKHCRVRVNGLQMGVVMPKGRDTDMKAALNQAISKVSRTVSKKLRRHQHRALSGSRWKRTSRESSYVPFSAQNLTPTAVSNV